jgi:hypothetical protein
LGGAPVTGTPYWISWEGVGETGGMPEEFGWTRNWGNWHGQYQGPGAYRTLEDGILTYDSLYDPGVFDFSFIKRLGQIDPGPNEVFVMEWRLRVRQVIGTSDPGLSVSSDAAWIVGLAFSETAVISLFEDFVRIPITPWVFHEYRLLSSDMRVYDLFIDGALARTGTFWEGIGPSEVGWGDSVQGAASLHDWDYFRFGVIPEPHCLVLLLVPCVCQWGRRA